MPDPTPAHPRRATALLARVGLLSLTLLLAVAALAIDVATCPAPEVEQHAAAAGTWSLKLLSHDDRMLGGFPEGVALRLSPLVHYENQPRAEAVDGYRINASGCRGPELDDEDTRPATIVTGGSAAFGLFVPEPRIFTATLAERLPDVRVVNAGVVGYLSAQETALVATRLIDLQPRLIVAMNGWNDCYDGVLWWHATGQEHAVPGVNSSFQIMENRLARYREIQLNPRAATEAWWQACRRRSRLLGWLPSSAVESKDRGAYPAEHLERAARAYVDNMRHLARLANAHEARLLVVVQPEAGQLAGETPPHRLAAQLRPELYARFRELTVEPLREAGIEVIDASERFAELGYEAPIVFLDHVHLTPEGHKRLANLLEPLVREAGL